MNKISLLFVAAAAVWACCEGYMSLVTLPEAVSKMGAMCLDGSPAAYYIREATKPQDADKFILFIHGGGWCYKEDDCLERTKTQFGSSTLMPPTNSYGDTILGEDPEQNPDFFSWNHVVFAYCDGASFTGAADKPIIVNGTKLYFRGFYNLKAIIHDLLVNHGLNKATEVILAGESAGGLATFIHADQIAEMLPSTVKRYKAVPMSGLFLRHNNVNGEPVYESQLQYTFMMHNSTAGVDPHCLLAKSPMYMHYCMFAEETIKSTQTPIFVSNSIYDRWAARCIMTAEPVDPSSSINGNCTAAPGWAPCIDEEECTSEQWDLFNKDYGDDFRDVITGIKAFQKDGNGVFAYSCYYHSAEITEHWNRFAINGVTLRQALTRWYKSDMEPANKHTYIDCRINGNFLCNPTCAL